MGGGRGCWVIYTWFHSIVLPSLTGQSPFNGTDRNMLALPTQLGGLGIINPSLMSSHHCTTSINVTSSLANLVITRRTLMPPDLEIQQFEEKNLAHNQRKAMESVTELLAINSQPNRNDL